MKHKQSKQSFPNDSILILACDLRKEAEGFIVDVLWCAECGWPLITASEKILEPQGLLIKRSPFSNFSEFSKKWKKDEKEEKQICI